MLPVLIAGEMPLLNAILAIMAGTRVATLVLPPVCKGLPRHTTYAIIAIRFFSIPTPEGCASLSVPTVSGEHTGLHTCDPCYSSGSGPYNTCSTCSGGNYYECTSCNSGTFFYPNIGGECLNPCPNAFWGQTTSNTYLSTLQQ
jgi:hypothetical protein